MAEKKVIIVTGANTGLGLALVRRFCQQYGEEALVYLTARNRERGLEAVEQLKKEGLNPGFHLLDVGDNASVETFARFIKQSHGGVDIVISNAAARIIRDTPQSEQVEDFINTNNHGTYRMLKYFGPLLRNGARFIVVASSFGSLRHLDPRLHSKFDVASLAPEEIENVLDEYCQEMKSGKAEEQGWPDWINIPSKIGQVALVKAFARDMRQEAKKRDILINAACPGLIDTEASRPWFKDMSHAQSPDKAAIDVVWLATLPPGTEEPYGELVQFRKVLPFR